MADQARKPQICSTAGADGYRISCPCSAVFAVEDWLQPAFCPECHRRFDPGYVVQMTVVSRRSGMPVSKMTGGEPAATPAEAAAKAAARAYSAEDLERFAPKVESSEPAWFDAPR